MFILYYSVIFIFFIDSTITLFLKRFILCFKIVRLNYIKEFITFLFGFKINKILFNHILKKSSGNFFKTFIRKLIELIFVESKR